MRWGKESELQGEDFRALLGNPFNLIKESERPTQKLFKSFLDFFLDNNDKEN